MTQTLPNTGCEENIPLDERGSLPPQRSDLGPVREQAKRKNEINRLEAAQTDQISTPLFPDGPLAFSSRFEKDTANSEKSGKTGADPSIVIDTQPESSRPAEDASEQGAVAFDENDYLVAFPEIAIAICAGTYASAWQHYMEHGKRENRLSQDRYRRAIKGRQAEGNIDFYGHNSLAGGWIFCGWTSEPWDENDPMSMVARFEKGDVSGECFGARYRRHHLKKNGTGLVLFIQGSGEAFGPLKSVAVRLGDRKMTIFAKPDAHQFDNQTIASETRSILVKEQGSDNSRELLMLLSTSGYGRFRRLPLNTLDGFIDFYGYHGPSGRWCLCGWTTRSWDQEVGPERLTLHFSDGDVVGEDVLAGFYPREDIEGKGVGFLMAVRGPDRPLGSLISTALHLDNVRSFFQASPSVNRCREIELTERLLPIAGQVAEPCTNSALLALLSRRTYTGSDTLECLSDRIFLEFDEVIICPPAGLLLMGWLLAKPGSLLAMRLRSADLNERFDLSECLKIERPDVISAVGSEHGFDDARCGFIAYLPANVLPDAHLYMEVETSRRQIGYRKLPASKLDGISAIKRVLDAFDVRYAEVPRAYDRTIGPAIELLNRRRLAERPSVDAIDFGCVSTSPRFSIIIPLYGRLDFIEYQMAFMSDHPPMKGYEFIFVLDDPLKRQEALRLFDSVHSRFLIPFRLLLLEHNVGFAPASNVGLRSANGTYVCFLNSDVFPRTPDWLERLAQRLEQDKDIGAVGPLLLYGDGTIQHEGMDFRNLPEFGNLLFGDHPRKGMRKSTLSGLRKHISITGACMLIKRDLAGMLGGFDESYVIGDFEDSDLCLRLHTMGLDSVVDLDVQLYHLERKSQTSPAQTWRMNMTLYNAWVHQRRWADAIAAHPLRQMTIPTACADHSV